MIERVLFVTLSNDVGSERIVSDVGRLGVRCAVMGIAGAFATLCRCVEGRFDVPSPGRGFSAVLAIPRRLEQAFVAWCPDVIVPLDELAANLLRALASSLGTSPYLRAVLIRSLGDPTGFDAVRQRAALMQVASLSGVRIPPFAIVRSIGEAIGAARSVGFPLMVKRDQTSGAAGVDQVDGAGRLAAAVSFALAKTAFKSGISRLAGIKQTASPVLLQKFVVGRLAMHTAVCFDGRYVDGASFAAVQADPVTRASTVLKPITHAGMAAAARALIETLGCSGFVSFDFLIEGDGQASLIEMNARPIGSAHLGRLFGHDLAWAFIHGQYAPDGRRGGGPKAIALFPKELERDPSGRVLRGRRTLHDIPHTEPAVVAAYREHLSRLHPTRAAEIGRACLVAPPESLTLTSSIPPVGMRLAS